MMVLNGRRLAFVFRHVSGHSHGGVLLVEAVASQGAGGPGGQDVQEDVHLRTQNTPSDTFRTAPAGLGALDTS